MNCICGKDCDSFSATPWTSVTMDTTGKIIRGICLHGINFDFGEFRLGEEVKILKGDIWTGCQGKVKHKAGSGEIGVELIIDPYYSPVTVWILPENLKKVN